MNGSILIVAGEASGDNVGGLFSAELKQLRPDIQLFGLGGDRMGMSGVDIIYHINQLAFLGFWEVMKHIPFMHKVEKDILKQVETRKPSLAVLIDYPGFNLRLAKMLKGMGIPIMYYVSPQVWAWGRGRISRIKSLVDKMVVVFRFEKEMYEDEGINAEWYGHPLLDTVKPKLNRDELCQRLGLDQNEEYIGLFPGSRIQEIEKILPSMKESLKIVSSSGMRIRGIVGCAPGIEDDIYMRAGGDALIYVRTMTYDLMAHSDLNLIASGTATLECAILGRPLFILYKTSPLTYMIAKRLVRIKHVGLVNVVAGERIVPEFIQRDCRGNLLAGEIIKFLSDPACRDEMVGRLKDIRGILGNPGASKRAAEIALRMAEVDDD